MTRVQDRSPGVRRTCEAHSERALASPAPVRTPLVGAAVLVPTGTLVCVLLGLSLGQSLAVVVAAALLAGVIAARTVRALFAGLALLVIRPYSPGELLRLYCEADDCWVEGAVVRIGMVNTTLATAEGLLVIANDRLLGSAPRLYEKSKRA